MKVSIEMIGMTVSIFCGALCDTLIRKSTDQAKKLGTKIVISNKTCLELSAFVL